MLALCLPPVPICTIVRAEESGQMIWLFCEHGQRRTVYLLATPCTFLLTPLECAGHEGPFLFTPLNQEGFYFNGIHGVGMWCRMEKSHNLLKATNATWPGRLSRRRGRDGYGCGMDHR
jgi:hypothetical protein